MRERACTNVRTSRRHSLLFSDKLTLHLRDQLLRIIRNVLRYETGQRRQLCCGTGIRDSHTCRKPLQLMRTKVNALRPQASDDARWSPSHVSRTPRLTARLARWRLLLLAPCVLPLLLLLLVVAVSVCSRKKTYASLRAEASQLQGVLQRC